MTAYSPTYYRHSAVRTRRSQRRLAAFIRAIAFFLALLIKELIA
ncbi:MAG: hypothetical protein E7E23_02285 [Paenibacillus sp.]|nr:hypothetical protein [Paenibacillus sp.]MDU2239379.1 hypothetical protein [Paenibacillus sp.]